MKGILVAVLLSALPLMAKAAPAQEYNYCHYRSLVAENFIQARKSGFSLEEMIPQAKILAENAGQTPSQVALSVWMLKWYYATGSDDIDFAYTSCLENHWMYL